MAIIKIKEGSLTIDVYDDSKPPELVASMHFPQENITFEESVVEVLQLNPAGKLVPGKLVPHGEGSRKISKRLPPTKP